MKGRLMTVAGLCAVWVVLIAARLYHLQVIQYDHYAGKAERQQQRVVTLHPPRGTIYDARGRELAVSIQVDSAYAVPPEIGSPVEAARKLAAVIPDLDPVKLARQLVKDRDREFVWVARKLDPSVAEKVRALKMPGLYFLQESKRYYPMGSLAAQILGYVGTDNHGLAGLELVYDQEVSGKEGRRTVLRDAKRGTLISPDLSFAEAEPGHDLHLTIDATIQHIVERELAKAVKERRAKRGTVLLLDPRTGGVLAMASYPSFDPNHFARYPKSRWRNGAIMDMYEPGSTFKIITAAAALESGLIRPEEAFDCEMGGITLLGIRIRDHKPFGRLTFAQVLEKSSNVGVIKAALRVGDKRLYNTIRGFGFGELTGIDLPGESGGLLHPVERWGPLAKAYVSFGQGVSVTPLQLAVATAAIANDGVRLKPHVVAAVSRGETRAPKFAQPPVAGRAILPSTARELQWMMEGVVTSGTAKAANVPGYRVAGKTGTAQIPVPGGYLRNGYLPSFVGFAPSDQPMMVGVVAIAEPQGWEYHGGQVAAPVFGAIARQVLLYLGIPPRRDRPMIWPGEMVLANLPPPAAADVEDVPTDGDDQPLATGANPVLWRPAQPVGGMPPRGGPPGADTATEAPESDHSSTEGGRSHASF
ncbi:MAG TPA: penicillin-binding protein 2 [Thermoanaerobaculia bacterium]|nr:penicillin-binding protein 2 [Thermoanaerobaculia bacterium]